MAIQKNTPSVVTNGLVLLFDVPNAKSYAGSGTTITNMVSKQGYTMNAGVTVSGNALSFDGSTNAYIDLGLNFTPNIYSKSIWLKTTSSSPSNFISGSDGEVFYAASGNIQICNTWQSAYVSAAANFYDNKWHNIACSYDGTNGRIYMDGVLLATGPMNAPISRTTYIGRYSTANNLNAQIAAIKIYGRVLTDAEFLQNYNALKGRFGL